MKSDWITETIYNDLKGKANKETRAQLSLVSPLVGKDHNS